MMKNKIGMSGWAWILIILILIVIVVIYFWLTGGNGVENISGGIPQPPALPN